MPVVNFVTHEGEQLAVDATSGASLMQAAVDNGVSGIVAECGGACSCATCHCYIDERWLAATGTAEGTERDLLECVAAPAPNSRLSCQITVTDDLDGIVVRLPAAQY